jgi:amylosucrase
MADLNWKPQEAIKSLNRILPGVEKKFADEIGNLGGEWQTFKFRLSARWEQLFTYLHAIYGWQYDFFYTLQRVVDTMVEYWLQRPPELKSLDEKRQENPHWFVSEKVVGIVLYVDLFSDNLAKLNDHIPYFRKLGLNYLHLMPLFSVPVGENDGGYAVSDYRAINPDIGTMDQLSALARELREEGISLVLDFVFNHTSDEHYWAKKAKSGDPDYLNYYLTFPDRELPDQFQKYLRDIFPTVRRGSFTWNEEMQRWVWTTFNSFQWDLNYANPEVMRAMLAEMLHLANQGVEVLRLDAVPFIWKRLGTDCENQPEAHTIIRAFNAMAKIVAPCILFKSEAIVHPDNVIKYVHPDECQLSYNPMQMALLWESLATTEVKLLEYSMRHRSRIPDGCSWVNYLRCHDDIGWSFDDDDARKVGIDPVGHRKFLNEFYTGKHPGSFAKGVPFQFNPDTGDVRVSGTLSSLAGLEAAVETGDDVLIEKAVRRINMLWSIQVSIGGIPLLYAGDEFGQMNDYTYLTDPAKINDSRWVHRAKRRWEARDDLADQDTLEWRFFREMAKLFRLRKKIPAFRNGGMQVIGTGNPHLFGYIQSFENQKIIVINNFSDNSQTMDAAVLKRHGAKDEILDLLSDDEASIEGGLRLEGYRSVWLEVGEKPLDS